MVWALVLNAWLALLAITAAAAATWLCVRFWVKVYGRLHDKVHRSKAAERRR